MKKIAQILVLTVVGAYAINYLFYYFSETRSIENADKLNKYEEKVALVDGKEIKFVYPEDQKFLSDLIKEVRIKNESLNSAAKTINWIDANKKLCSSNIFKIEGLKKNWIGTFKTMTMDDTGTYVSIKIDIDHKNFILARGKRVEISDTLITSLKDYNKVMFSGYLTKGDMEQNQCIHSTDWDDNAYLVNNVFILDLTDLNKVILK